MKNLIDQIENRLTEIDDLLWDMSISEYRDEVELTREFERLNKMLSIAKGE